MARVLRNLFLFYLADAVKSCATYRAYSPCSRAPVLHYHLLSIQHRDFLFTFDTVCLDCWGTVRSCFGCPCRRNIGSGTCIFPIRWRSSNLHLAGCRLRDAGSRYLFLIAPFLHVGYNCLGTCLLHRYPAIPDEYHLRLYWQMLLARKVAAIVQCVRPPDNQRWLLQCLKLL